jgi:hypothetical protein
MLKRRLKQAGLPAHYSPHSFRATGITNFLENDGTLEAAQRIAGHADSRTTKLYDRRGQKVLLVEYESVNSTILDMGSCLQGKSCKFRKKSSCKERLCPITVRISRTVHLRKENVATSVHEFFRHLWFPGPNASPGEDLF